MKKVWGMTSSLSPPSARRLLLALLGGAALTLAAAAPAQSFARFDIAGLYSWTVPACVSSVSVLVVAGGGGGGANSAGDAEGAGGGGGGGVLCVSDVTVTPGAQVAVAVGPGGAAARSSQWALPGSEPPTTRLAFAPSRSGRNSSFGALVALGGGGGGTGSLDGVTPPPEGISHWKGRSGHSHLG